MSRYPSLVTGPKRIVQIFRGRWLLSGVLSVSLVGVWMGYYFGGGADSTGSNQKLRSKLFTLNPNSSSLVHSSKLRGPLRVEIRREEKGENQPIDLDRPFTLVAVISSEMALPSLNLKWSLPEGVAIQEGQEELTLGPLEAEEEIRIPLRLVTTSQLNQKIHVLVRGAQEDYVFGESAQYNTLNQEVIELDKADLAKRSKKYMKDQTEIQTQLRYKIFR